MMFPEITGQSLRGKPEFSEKKKREKVHVKIKCQEITVNRLLLSFSPWIYFFRLQCCHFCELYERSNKESK